MYDAAFHPFNGNHTECQGITRPVVEEGQIHFVDLESAETWIARHSYFLDDSKVLTNDGLLIRWAINPQRSQMAVDLWQICIRGERPTKLKGASDQSIKIFHPNGSELARQDCAHVPESVYEETRKPWDDQWRKVNDSILAGEWKLNSDRIQFRVWEGKVGDGTYYHDERLCYKFSYTITGDVLTDIVMTETPEVPNPCGITSKHSFHVSKDNNISPNIVTLKLISPPLNDTILMLQMTRSEIPFELKLERIASKN